MLCVLRTFGVICPSHIGCMGFLSAVMCPIPVFVVFYAHDDYSLFFVEYYEDSQAFNILLV